MLRFVNRRWLKILSGGFDRSSSKAAPRSRQCFVPRLDGLEDRLCPSGTAVLPISAFLSQQGHHSVFTPPVPDQLSWTNSIFDPGTTPSDPTRDLLADYTGLEAQYLLSHGINLHTSVAGFVTETPVPGGLMEVSVNLETTNALTWVANINGINGNLPGALGTAPLEFGYRAQDLLANPSLKPALSSVNFQITWQEQQGAALPDLAELNENFAMYAPPGFTFERFDVQVWGTGTLDPATTQGTPGQTAMVFTTQMGDLTNPSLPGTLADGFWREPVSIVPVASASTHVAYLNGTIMVSDTGNGNHHISVTPTAGGGATVSSDLGNATFNSVTEVDVNLGNGNNTVQIGNLPSTTVSLTALDGNNHINIGNVAKLSLHVGQGNNDITTGNTGPGAQMIFVSGNGNNHIDAGNSTAAEIIVAGAGNNHISATGTGDIIEVLGNGNNHISDVGQGDLVEVGGDGNNDIDNAGLGSAIVIWAGKNHH
jgi:hypothetical protein